MVSIYPPNDFRLVAFDHISFGIQFRPRDQQLAVSQSGRPSCERRS